MFFVEHLNIDITNVNFANSGILLNFLIKQKIWRIMFFREFSFSMAVARPHDNKIMITV